MDPAKAKITTQRYETIKGDPYGLIVITDPRSQDRNPNRLGIIGG